MPKPENPNASLIQVSMNAKALLRDLGWSDQQIEAALRKPKWHSQAARSVAREWSSQGTFLLVVAQRKLIISRIEPQRLVDLAW
jgi:hypothetical protein